MHRGVVWLAGVGLLLLGYFLGQASGPAPVEFPDPSEARSAEEMERAVESALSEPRAFPRAVTLVRLFEGLTSENVAGAARAVSSRAGRWDPVDLQLFLAAWVHVDPLAAVREVESWPIRSRRQIGLTIAIREWAASGHWLEAADYFQTIRDPDTRSIAAGPLVRGWALAGDLDGALGLAHRLWSTEDQLDVVDGFARGVLHAQGPQAALDIARRVDQVEQGEFAQRLTRVTLNLVAREDAPAAAALYQELVSEGTPAWMDGTLDRVASLWRNDDPRSALEWMLGLAPTPERDRVLGETIATWGIRDFDTAWAWFEGTRGPFSGQGVLDPTDSVLLGGLVRKMARIRSAEAADWALRLRPGAERDALLRRVSYFWSLEDPAATSRWIEGLDASPALRRELREAAARAQRAAEPEFSGEAAESVDSTAATTQAD